jgi:hypothetical protein
VIARLACISIAAAFRDGMAFLLANARRAHFAAIARPDDSVPVSLSSENAPTLITYEALQEPLADGQVSGQLPEVKPSHDVRCEFATANSASVG